MENKSSSKKIAELQIKRAENHVKSCEIKLKNAKEKLELIQQMIKSNKSIEEIVAFPMCW